MTQKRCAERVLFRSKMKQQKIQMMIYLSTFFFLLELIFGYISGSIALIADSFHMLSDVASLFIALYAHNVRKY
jgi:zinc transporter 1